MIFRYASILLLLFGPSMALSQPNDDTALDEDPLTYALPVGPTQLPSVESLFDMDAGFALDPRDRVISAARTETTIQEAPAIVTVITSEEISDRGFRTIIEVLQTIPGFEGDRPEGNHWIVDTYARGNPRTVLILINGINVVEPARNMIVLDRKIPLEIVERIEVISGPGGVLWGSNALLGVVNIITTEAPQEELWHFRVGGGHGPGDLGAVDLGVTYGGALGENISLLASGNLYSSRGAELIPDAQKIVGVLPAPTPDGMSLFIGEPITTDPSRDYFFSFYLDLQIHDFRINSFVEWERDYRQLGFGGGVLTTDIRSPEVAELVGPVDIETSGNDALMWLSAQYSRRYWQDQMGLGVTSYFVRWVVEEDPFGSFPPSDLLPRGMSTVFYDEGQYRFGTNLDLDFSLPYHNTLIAGAEVFVDIMRGILQTFPEDPTDAENLSVYTDQLVNPVERAIGALYLSNEWLASRTLAINGGARLQVSNTYSPALLFASALVWNLAGETFLKANYTEGFRPPEFQATDTNSDIQSGITLQPNPDLTVERSRSIEGEVNTVLFRDVGPIDRWFLRADYSFTVLDDMIQQSASGFANSGRRLIHSVEVLSRLTTESNHELSFAYYFVTGEDENSGELRNIANQIFNGHSRIQLVQDLLHFSCDLTWIGPREDLNRKVPDGEGLVEVFPSDVILEQLDSVWLLRAGFRAQGIADRLGFSVFGYNMLNQHYYQPDTFFDDRVATRPVPMPGWSLFASMDMAF